MNVKEKVKEIVEHMISYGTEHTLYGTWTFEIPALCESFALTPAWFYAHNDDILDELYDHEEILDVVQEFDYNGNPTDYNVNFGTRYCGLEED